MCSVDYRRAPEHVFPAAHADCIAVARHIALDATANAGIILAGDSAGGNIAAAAARALRDDADASCSCAVLAQLLVYPVTDCTCVCPPQRPWDLLQVPPLPSPFLPSPLPPPSYPALQPSAMDEFISMYLPDPASRTHHHASPLLAALPSRRAAALHAPAFVLLCQCDLLQPQGLRYADKLRAEGCDVQVST